MAVPTNRAAAVPFAPAQAQRARRQRNADEPETMIWVNVGYYHENEQTGETTFVSLPMGIPIDTMNEAEERGTNEEFIQLTQAKNALLAHMRDLSKDLAPGEEMDVDFLQIQMRRRVDAVSQARNAPNPYLSSLSKLAFARKAG